MTSIRIIGNWSSAAGRTPAGSGYVGTTETFNFRLGQWRQTAGDFPVLVNKGSSMQNGNSFLVRRFSQSGSYSVSVYTNVRVAWSQAFSGWNIQDWGYRKDIYRFDPGTQQWVTLTTQMRQAGERIAAIPVNQEWFE